MPEFSKIRTFYIKRRNHRAELPAQWMEGSRCERVVAPAVAYKMCLTSSGNAQNILVQTVVDLMKVYRAEGMERGAAMDRIAQRTLLDRLLVRAILKRYENNVDLETGEENEGITQSFYYLVYDPVSRQTFREMIPAEEYEEGKLLERVEPETVDLLREEDAALRFQLRMSEKRQSAWVFHPGGGPLAAPLNPPVSRDIERRYCRGRNSSLTYLGISEPVGLICTCYLSESDLSAVHVMNPVGKGAMDQLYARIRDTLRAEPGRDEELARHMEDMESARRGALEAAENYSGTHGVMKQNLQNRYPGIEMYRDVWEHMATLEARCAVYEEALKGGGAGEEVDSAAKHCLVAFYSALEELFALSLNKNYPREKAKQVNGMLDVLEGNRNYASYYAGIAELAGFEDAEACRRFFEGKDGRIKIVVLKSVLSGAQRGGQIQRSLPELVAAHMIQAAAEENHPFRQAADRCPELLPLVQAAKKKRDIFKHGLDSRAIESQDHAEAPTQGEIVQMRVLAETMLEILLVPRASEEEQKRRAAAYDSRQASRIRAKEALAAYPALEALAGRTAAQVCFRFFYQDPEYISTCSNLISGLFDVLFSEYSNQSQRQAAAERFSGDREADDAAMHALFQRYGCDYPSDDRPNTGRIRHFSYNVKDLSVKCKLYLGFVMLDREDPALLRRLLEKSPGLPRLTDRVCVERGHNARTEFSDSPDGYASFHRELMETCSQFCKVMQAGRARR